MAVLKNGKFISEFRGSQASDISPGLGEFKAGFIMVMGGCNGVLGDQTTLIILLGAWEHDFVIYSGITVDS